MSFNCRNRFYLPAEDSYCPLKVGFWRKGQFWCFSLGGFHNAALFCYCPAFDPSVFSVFHHIEIVVGQTHRWWSAFDLGSLWALSSFRFIITKSLILSPETLPYTVAFIGSRDWLGPGVFEGHRFHLTSHSWYTPAPCTKYAHPAPAAPRLAAHYGVSANLDLIETTSVPQASVSSLEASKSGVGKTEYNPLWLRIPLPLQIWNQDRLLACKTQEWVWLWNPVLERPIQSRRTLKEERQQPQFPDLARQIPLGYKAWGESSAFKYFLKTNF